jgi:FtsP/CotA-like multicopper oxidase with cupredoxin domain
MLIAAVLATPIPAQSQETPLGPLPAPEAFLIPAGTRSGLPLVQPNDNTRPAGTMREGVREISLEVLRADFRVESSRGPGLRVAAVAEEGGAPMIPAPLIRVDEGTSIRVRVLNSLEDTPITVFGLHQRPIDEAEGFELAPGEARTVEFSAGEPGTYLYSIQEGTPPEPRPDGFPVAEREQLAGAFVVDPAGSTATDRIMVINIFGQLTQTEGAEPEYLEGLTINGRSWPYTERMQLSVGQTERWRVVNASGRFHPMHLHGFFFSVLSRGTMTADTVYAPESHRLAVTEPMRGGTTMLMEWTPTREGRWIFHCHLSFHVSAEIRLPGAVEADPEHAHSHMAGLAVGIDVAPGPSDLVWEGPPVEVDLFVNEYGEEPGYRYGFTGVAGSVPDASSEVPGPLLVFNQYQVADVTVRNDMGVPTGVHWHGLELDAWADGVPGWSASAGRVSPTLQPGESFTYRLSMMRPGTFMYHSHLNDVVQLSGGLYGPLLVLPQGEEYDPTTDHVKVWGWNTPNPGGPSDFDLNGTQEQPDAETTVGTTHRFRVIHIAPAGQLTAWVSRDGEVVPIRLHAKDGADLPEQQQVLVDRLPRLGVGETADFLWTPDAPGVYQVHIGFGEGLNFPQRWVVTGEGEAPDREPRQR